ncbi:MAG: MCE family protein [Cellvibrionaceae bacterium]|nr:MCE family protein [Cellvibrionaceae bacterium]
MNRVRNSATVNKMASLSPVWFVPAVAVLIALWLVVQAHLEKGAQVQIIFDSAPDIIANQTLVKLNDVQVGTVQRVKLSSDLRKVVVMVELDREVAKHLSENSRFWIVTPRVTASGVSNLGTLISGVYIVMDPGEPGSYQTSFQGLGEPPLYQSDEEGTQYVLQAEELGSLDIGSPIYYRQIRVGEVTSYRLAANRDYVDVNIFVRAPYDELVQTRSRFWNVSGFGMSINADGIKAHMGSLASLISGGVAFGNGTSFKNIRVAKAGRRFMLYEDRDSVLDGRFNLKYYYLLKFSSSVRGLSVGAPVEFRGIKIGEVVDVELAGSENAQSRLRVYIALEPQRLEPKETPSRNELDQRIEEMVRQGLRAKMKTANLITGSRYINLEFTDLDSGQFSRGEKYSEIPTVPDEIDQIGNQLADVLDKVSAIPFDKIGNHLSGSLRSMSNLLAKLDEKNTAEKFDGAIENLETTLQSTNLAIVEMNKAMASLDQAIAPDSELKYELTQMAKSLGDAGKSLELFLNELNRQPNSLITGREKDD